MAALDVRYARSGDVAIAYHVLLGDQEWRRLLERHHALVRRELARFRGEERDTAGDGFFATFDGPARAIRCTRARSPGFAVAAGSRVAALAHPGEVLVSSTVRDLVAGSGIELEDRGEHELRGVGPRRLYSVLDA